MSTSPVGPHGQPYNVLLNRAGRTELDLSEMLVGSQLEVVRTQVCRTQDEVLTTGEQWKAKLLKEGWT